MQNGKGDKRRPLTVPREQFEKNWDSINWGKKKDTDHDGWEHVKKDNLLGDNGNVWI